jgi:hypothetical protein
MILPVSRFNGGDGRRVYIDQQPQEALAIASPKVLPATARFAAPAQLTHLARWPASVGEGEVLCSVPYVSTTLRHPLGRSV